MNSNEALCIAQGTLLSVCDLNGKEIKEEIYVYVQLIPLLYSRNNTTAL